MRRNRILKFSAGRLLKYSGFRILHETHVLKLYTRARDVITLQSLCWLLFATILEHLVFNISQSKNTVILLLLRLGDPNRIPFDPCLKSFFVIALVLAPSVLMPKYLLRRLLIFKTVATCLGSLAGFSMSII